MTRPHIIPAPVGGEWMEWYGTASARHLLWIAGPGGEWTEWVGNSHTVTWRRMGEELGDPDFSLLLLPGEIHENGEAGALVSKMEDFWGPTWPAFLVAQEHLVERGIRRLRLTAALEGTKGKTVWIPLE